MKTLLYTFFIAVCCLVVNCGPVINRTANRNNMDGWHFHVCLNDTKASRVWFELSGTTKKDKYQSREVKWMAGKSSFVAVPEDMRYMNDLNLSIRTSGNRKAKVCILYGDFVVESVDVSGTENQKLSREHRDECPC
jgi:hypothetical protein